MRAIGFLPSHIVRFILIEGLVLGALGGLLGLAVGYPLIQGGIGPALEQNLGQMFAVFRVTPELAALSFVLALVLGAVAAVIPARTAAKLEVISALRRVG